MKRFLSLVMALCVLLLSLGTISINAATTLEGAGTAESPYLIKSTEDFLLIGTSDYSVIRILPRSRSGRSFCCRCSWWSVMGWRKALAGN